MLGRGCGAPVWRRVARSGSGARHLPLCGASIAECQDLGALWLCRRCLCIACQALTSQERLLRETFLRAMGRGGVEGSCCSTGVGRRLRVLAELGGSCWSRCRVRTSKVGLAFVCCC